MENFEVNHLCGHAEMHYAIANKEHLESHEIPRLQNEKCTDCKTKEAEK
jgi:hypothetical protein